MNPTFNLHKLNDAGCSDERVKQCMATDKTLMAVTCCWSLKLLLSSQRYGTYQVYVYTVKLPQSVTSHTERLEGL